MNIRYVVTAIKKGGLRELAFDNNSRNTYATEEEATQKMQDVINNNNPETVAELVGTDLKVLPVQCYAGGDSTKTIFSEGNTMFKNAEYTLYYCTFGKGQRQLRLTDDGVILRNGCKPVLTKNKIVR